MHAHTSADRAAGRDAAIIALIGLSHFTSHFFQLALPPLFPLLKAHYDVSYAALGAVMSLFYAASGLCQAFAGILVDRFGGRRVLMAGTATLTGAIALAGVAPEFWMLYPLAILAGIGNSVYHPADYAVLSQTVSKARLGRAYSVHGLGGTLGYAVSPVVLGAVVQVWSWPVALLAAAAMGAILLIALARANALMTPGPAPEAGAPAVAPEVGFFALLARPAMVAGFLYFALAASAGIGLQNGGVPAMMTLYEVRIDQAAWMITAFLVASAGGMLVGGLVADRTARHDTVAITGIALSAACMLTIATLPQPFVLVVAIAGLAGGALGFTNPSRDMLIRAASPPGATGRVFGVVYSGLDIGSATMPVVAGWLLDRGEPRVLFVVLAAALLLTIATVLQVRRGAVQAVA